jgi:L-ascorbate metabolism protein UlaG (beta-lactamase superfamily)
MVKVYKWLPIAIIPGAIGTLRPTRRAKPNAGSGLFVEAFRADRSDVLQPVRWPNDALTIANLGHSTLLMNFLGVRVITDPTLFARVGLRVGPLFTIGLRRMSAPVIGPQQLPHLDVILVTHAHMDHLDLNSLLALPKTATVVTCVGGARLIKPLGYLDVRELGWREHTSVKDLRITAMGANHWGERWPWGHRYGFNSYVLEKKGHRMLLACDSAMTDIFATLRAHPPDVAAFSIGAYDPWIRSHANPEQVWTMFVETGARYLIPIHWGTFRLSKEPMNEPMERLLAAAGPAADRVILRRIGGAWSLPESMARCESASGGLPEPGAVHCDDRGWRR